MESPIPGLPPIPGVPPGALPDIPALLGPIAITACIALLIYGVTVVQAYAYVLNYKKDDTWVKSLVYGVAFFETVHTAVILALYWDTFIHFREDLLAIVHIPWTVPTVFLINCGITILVQGFYIRRIWILSNRSLALLILLITILTLRIGFAIATFAFFVKLDTWQSFRDQTGPLVTISTGLGLAVLMDMCVAGLLIYYLVRGRSGLRRTDGIISFLIAYSVNTGLLSMAVSIAIVFTFAFMKESLIFAGLNLIAGKLYANSLLGTLNARQVLRAQSSRKAHITMPDSHRVILPGEHSRSVQFTSKVNVKTDVESKYA
ncbi:unnamed protein product [Somion occarium]|uniref:DUF6534 domain-containing protein n=1 Tax=Somion occarium TaxID=3059160 RepID=A0ABP1D8M1_9APHY